MTRHTCWVRAQVTARTGRAVSMLVEDKWQRQRAATLPANQLMEQRPSDADGYVEVRVPVKWAYQNKLPLGPVA